MSQGKILQQNAVSTHTTAPLTTSPPGTHSEFEDLIDLLATDEPVPALQPDIFTSADATNSAGPPSIKRIEQTPRLEDPASLHHSLALAQQEVALLQLRCRELGDLVHKFRSIQPREHVREAETGGEPFQSHSSPQEDGLGPDSGLNPENNSTLEVQDTVIVNDVAETSSINALTFAQTRIVLEALLNDLALPLSCLTSLLKDGRKRPRAIPTTSLDEIHRAVDMINFVDELVWRRSRLGAAYGNPYSEENIQALRSRLELWERTVRTRR